MEIGQPLRFLLDLAERGPTSLRHRALEAAARIGEQVVLRGVMPDGVVAPVYRPGRTKWLL